MFFLVFSFFCWANDLLINNVRIVDARGDMGVHSVLIKNKLIADIDPKELPEGVAQLNAENLTMLPGLIDAHVHITMTPGQAHYEETPEQRARRHAYHMRAFLALGITTIVDPGISVPEAKLVRQLQAQGPSPRILFAGPLLGPKNGYPANVVASLEGVENIEEVRQRIKEFEPFQPIGIKVAIEDGLLLPVMPMFSPTLRQQIKAEAHKNGHKLYIHATDKKAVNQALDMQPHALVHGPHKYNRRLMKRIIDADVYVCSTIDILAGALAYWDSKSIDNPMLQDVVPADELAAARDPRIRKKFIEDAWKASAPGWPLWIGRMLYRKSLIRPRVKQAIKVISKLHENGVKIVLASDSSGWPIVPYLFHGPSTHLEISLLQQAGLSELEIIKAGTLTPAQMIGMESQLGTVEKGKIADLILVNQDPLKDITTLQKPKWVIRAGELRRPQDWLQGK